MLIVRTLLVLSLTSICFAEAENPHSPPQSEEQNARESRERKPEQYPRDAQLRLQLKDKAELKPQAGKVLATRAEVPEKLLEKARTNLLTRVKGQDIVIKNSEAVVWSNGAMACGKPGMTYTQAPVKGYRIVFKADGKLWNYHMNERGGFVLCERSKIDRSRTVPAK